MSETTRRPNQGKAAKDLNEVIRYTMWSVFRLRDVLGDADLVRAALADLRDAVGLSAPPVDSHVQRWGGALPQYAVGHLDRVRRVRAAVARHPGLAVAGAAYDGVGVPAVARSGRQAARTATQGWAEAGWTS